MIQESFTHVSFIAYLLEKIQPKAPFRHRKPVYVGYIRSSGPQKPNPQDSRAISLETIQHTVRKGAKGASILHKLQYSRPGSSEVLGGLHDG